MRDVDELARLLDVARRQVKEQRLSDGLESARSYTASLFERIDALQPKASEDDSASGRLDSC